MKGDERARFCGECRKHVYNFSAMSAEAAAELVRAKEGRLCVRFYRRADGTMLHAEDCPVGFAARQWRRVKHIAGAAASLVLLLFGAQRAEAGDSKTGNGKSPAVQPTPTPAQPRVPVMGKICPPSTPSPSPTPKPKQ